LPRRRARAAGEPRAPLRRATRSSASGAGARGLKPTEQRAEEIGDYRVAAFGSTGEAAYAYALNLNTQDAYRDFRLKRAELRRRNLRVSGEVLVETLIHYSERGQAYVEDLKTIIRQNRLADTDDAYLRDMPVIRIVDAYATSK